ncbi:hypothetical protein BM221_008697 [Beauveria bassiana]|uniref:DUF1308 domain-containing protein n=1 Tax=Beauveria bassiana TaxID=176275 RepID=A0A2N6NDJ2_BEABA|nr:hypothetical protein BM221_008697 [Beauveria bassiana]
MNDYNSQEDRSDDDDIALRRQKLIDFAITQLKAARHCIPELEALLVALAPKVKSVFATGLVTFVRDLIHDVRTIEAILQEPALRQALPPPQQHHEEEDEEEEEHGCTSPHASSRADLDALWKRLEPRTTGAYHAITRWQVLRRCADLVAVKRTFQGSVREARRAAVLARSGPLADAADKAQLHRTMREQAKTEVAVVERGACWVDVRWINAERLARQMTDAGWSWGEYAAGDVVDADEWEDTPFVKQVKRVVAAARCNRHEYQIPRIRLVLPNLARGAQLDIDVLLEQLSRLDPGVDLAIEDSTSDFLTRPAGSLDDAVRRLVGSGSLQVPLTDTLNLEHTVLVDLISDLTHIRLVPYAWQSRTTRAQIEEENTHPDGVMAPFLYPLLRGRRLVCTHEAAKHFHEMLTTVGTQTERERGHLLVPSPNYTAAAQSAPSSATTTTTTTTARARFNALSERPLPADVQFPVEVLPANEPWNQDRVRRFVQDGTLPRVALDIARRGRLKSSKLSTYMHGWREGVVTLTSNKEIRAHLRTWVEAGRTNDAECGPMVYCVEVTRNLLAKNAVPPPGWMYWSEGSEDSRGGQGE